MKTNDAKAAKKTIYGKKKNDLLPNGDGSPNSGQNGTPAHKQGERGVQLSRRRGGKKT